MAQTYEPKQELLAAFWSDITCLLTPGQAARLDRLPEPCRNHVEDRLKKPSRASKLAAGCRRLARHDPELFLEGLRLYPHAVCRLAETIGPTREEMWNQVVEQLEPHRLWRVAALLENRHEDQSLLWEAVETLAPYRELPQPVLDFLEERRPENEAPWEEFATSLHRYLVRARLEKLRFQTYTALREPTPHEPMVE